MVSLSMATSLDEDLVTCPCAGFLCITAVSVESQMITVLSPAPSPLPRKFLLLSDVEFVDFK
jgi:polyribonucleotide 5'-hydroxyl-kinase